MFGRGEKDWSVEFLGWLKSPLGSSLKVERAMLITKQRVVTD
ncbi:MAG: hypothetical protein WCJ35_01485 [Planctomycetota bacterium]